MEYSVVIVVIMTGSKIDGILHPLKTLHDKFNRKKPVIYACLALIFCSIINSHYLITHSIVKIYFNITIDNTTIKTENQICTYFKWFNFYELYWPYIDAMLYSFFPFVLISIFNIIIISNLRKSKKQSLELRQYGSLSLARNFKIFFEKKKKSSILLKKENLEKCNNDVLAVRYSNNANQNDPNSDYELNKTESIQLLNIGTVFERRMAFVEQHKEYSLGVLITALQTNKMKKSHKSVTLFIFLVDISFLLFTMPIVVLQLIIQTSQYYDKEEFSTEMRFKNNNYKDLLKSIFEILQYLNHSLSFFLYCLSGETFRTETKMYFSVILSYLIGFKNLVCNFNFH
jgi:hypothetical protein